MTLSAILDHYLSVRSFPCQCWLATNSLASITESLLWSAKIRILGIHILLPGFFCSEIISQRANYGFKCCNYFCVNSYAFSSENLRTVFVAWFTKYNHAHDASRRARKWCLCFCFDVTWRIFLRTHIFSWNWNCVNLVLHGLKWCYLISSKDEYLKGH